MFDSVPMYDSKRPLSHPLQKRTWVKVCRRITSGAHDSSVAYPNALQVSGDEEWLLATQLEKLQARRLFGDVTGEM